MVKTRRELINEIYCILRELKAIENVEEGLCPSGSSVLDHNEVKCLCWVG